MEEGKRGLKMRKDFIVVCMYISRFCRNLNLSSFSLFLFPYVLCVERKKEDRKEDAKKENFNGAVEEKNQFHKEALRSFIQDFLS